MKGGEGILLAGRSVKRFWSHPVTIYTLCKVIPLIGFLAGGGPAVKTATFLFSVASFFIQKNICGIQMVGLKWSFDFRNFCFTFYSQPEPFIPAAGTSNIFWAGNMMVCLIWIIFFFAAILMRVTAGASLSFLCLGTEAVNLVLFTRAHTDGRQSLARDIRLGINDGAQFELVPEDDK